LTRVVVCFPGPFEERQSVPSPQSDPVFQIAVDGGRNTFRIGELIPIELHFSSVSNGYRLIYSSCERNGRIDFDTFLVQPQKGWTDSLRTYFVRPRSLEHPRSRDLNQTSSPIRLELNQWVRFDSPGSYRIRVISKRVFEPSVHRFVSLSSNEITIRIIPADKGWQETSYKAASAVVAGVRPSSPDGWLGWTRALKTLRYLGTIAAARELVRLLPDDGPEGDCRLGLIGSPVGKQFVGEIERLITVPDYPVSYKVLTALEFLRLPADIPDEAVEVRRDEERTKILPAILAAVDRKQGRALAETTATLLLRLQDTSPGEKSRLTRYLVSSFHHLSDQTLGFLLEVPVWNRLDHQVILPLLRQLAANQDGKDTGRASVADTAVRRLSELTPDEALVPR